MITGGVVAHPLARAFDVLRFFRDTCASLPDEAMLVAGLQTAPDGSNAKLVGIVGGHCGPLEQGEAAFRSLKAFGPPVMDMMGPMPYAALNGMIDPAFPKAALNYWKAQFLTDLSDEAIRTLIAGFQECPSPMSHIIIEHFHGAASRVPVTATACPMRVTGFNVVIASQWMDVGGDRTRHQVGSRDLLRHSRRILRRRATSTTWKTMLPIPPRSLTDRTSRRLRAIKTKYDPENFFRHNVNILPN